MCCVEQASEIDTRINPLHCPAKPLQFDKTKSIMFLHNSIASFLFLKDAYKFNITYSSPRKTQQYR